MDEIDKKSSKDFIDTEYILKILELDNVNSFLDIGCGDGHISFAVNKLNEDAIIYAVDKSEDTINYVNDKINKDNVKNIKAICCDVDKHIPLKDNTVNTVLMINVFHEFKTKRDKYKVLSEIKRVLTPGGQVALVEFRKVPMSFGPDFKYRLSHNELEKYFYNQGFAIEILNERMGIKTKYGYSHYLIIFSEQEFISIP